MKLIEDGSNICAKDLHPQKVFFLIDVTICGIDICFNNLQSLNALLPIDFRIVGSNILVKDEHPLKDFLSIEVTDDGIDISVSDEHP